MKNLFVRVVILVMAIGAVSPLYADNIITLGFEDIAMDPSEIQKKLPTDYAGLTWDSNWYYYSYLQWPLDPQESGPTRVFGGTWIDFGKDVTFLGSWVGTFAWGGDKYWLGYNNGNLIYESPHFSTDNINQGWINVYWPNVDYVKFVGSNGSSTIDDIRYIPEPATIGLLALGGLMLRKRKA